MINIRCNTFETNSSSTHSIVILGSKTYKEAFEAAFPDQIDYFKKLFDKAALMYTKEDVYRSLEDIGAKIADGVVDLSDIDEEEFDFGYVDDKAYADFAHKLLLTLTILDDDYNDYFESNRDYYRECLDEILNDYGIKSIIIPKNGFTGIDHQSASELSWEVKFKLNQFLTQKDYVLVLSHD